MLTEPTSVVAKAWEQVDRVGDRSWFEPRTVLVTGAGPIGLLAAMIGVQRGLDVHVLDRVTEGPKPDLVHDLGATYHATSVEEVAATHRPDVVLEATGVGKLVFSTMAETASYGIVCLTGVSSAGRRIPVDAGSLNREIVLENDVVVGRSTPTFGTTSRRPGRSPTLIRSGSTGWSRRRSRWRTRPTRSSGQAVMT